MRPTPENLRAGIKARFRGPPDNLQPLKPYPLGWQEIVEVGHIFSSANGLGGVVRVASDPRWIPAYLIEEITP